MKQLWVLCAVVVMSLVSSGSLHASDAKKEKAQAKAREDTATLVSGVVVETMDSGGYTYIQLEAKGKKIWVAVNKMKVTKGQTMSFRSGTEMINFESKTLKRTFDRILFSSGPVDQANGKTEPKTAAGNIVAADTIIKVDKAIGTNAYTVEELYKNSASLGAKQIVVRGKVVKISQNIMNLNWIHLQDSTGEPGKGTHNLVTTSVSGLPAVGDIVTASGILAVDRDFGSGYKYKIILENTTYSK
jgi:hypothetical protein